MFKKMLISTAFAVIREFLIDRINYLPLKQALLDLLNPAAEVADLLTDKNPSNSAQLQQFWDANKNLFLKNGIKNIKAAVTESVKDPLLRDMILAALEEIDENTGLRKPPSAIVRAELPQA